MIPLLKRVDGSVEWVEMGGLPLGVGLGAAFDYQEVTRNLSPDDLVILTSDGVVEASNAGDEIFGFERLEASVQSAPERDAAGMVKHLKAEVAEFVGGAEQYDDMTIVVVKT
jgi:phosphoserine phosphatase RsbU/P